MAGIELNEAFLAKIAGWEVVKHARALLATGRVLSSNWTPPLLKGVVQEGTTSYRAGLVIKDTINIENLCSCRQSREWGTVCVHAIAVGLHHLRRDEPVPLVPSISPSRNTVTATPSARPARTLQLAPPSAAVIPLELLIIFPPQLEAALARGRVMLCFESHIPRGRVPLNSLSLSLTYSASEQDRQILERLQTLAQGVLPAMLQLDAAQLADLLPKLAGHPGLTLGRNTALEVSTEPRQVALEAKLLPSGQIQLSRKSTGALPVMLEGDKDQHWFLSENRFSPLRLSKAWLPCLKAPLTLERSAVPIFLSRDWPALAASGAKALNFGLEDFTVEPLKPKISLHLTGGLAQLQAQLQATYGVRVIPLGIRSGDQDTWMPDPECVTRYWTRDPSSEQAAVGRLQRYGFTGPDNQGRYGVQGQTEVLNFFAREYPRLQREWQVTMEERLEKSCETNLERVQPEFQVIPSGVQWFDFSVGYRLRDGEQLPPAEIQRLLRSGQNHAKLKNGRFAVFDAEALDEFQETLRDCNPEQQGQNYRINSRQAAFLESSLQKNGWTLAAPPKWKERVRQQSGDALSPCPPLGSLESVLRPYQKHGVAWLQFLRENQFGGILADEMGLGKTLQTLAFLRSQTPPGAQTRPHLVICPTSLVYNWFLEATRFTPQLRPRVIHGAQRHAHWDNLDSVGLIITSYALIWRDAEHYRGMEFDTVVLDEAQHIKNRQTRNAQAVKTIRAQHRIVLTGTPLENSVFDLWSIFDFLMPGYLGSAQDFRERYEVPIARSTDKSAMGRLSRRLRPFILRRLKRDVATELPAKLEQVSFCELTDAQRALYQQVLEAGRREMLNTTGEGPGSGRSRMQVLTTLLRLRQICCDPRLLKLEQQKTDPIPSGKVELFLELLEEVIDGGHRVLVFSQFTEMLALLKEALEERKLSYCYLDGSTVDRVKAVEQFQKGDAPVFLISLKAGGVGLNLTAADTVIHFDPWWNPAVEDQATDRAHRIGQTRVVTGYKLIARDTVEEKILLLQQKKRELTQQALGGEESFTAALTWEELQSLLN